MKKLRTLWLWFVAVMLLSGCLPPRVIYVTATPPLPSATSDAPTATIDWFPTTPTITPTRYPTLEPTPNQKPGIGEIVYQDDFSDRTLWNVAVTQGGSIGYGINEITIALSSPKVRLVTSPKESLRLGDFYLEVTINPSLCKEEDTYGLMFRTQTNYDYYRLVFSCAGKIRLERVAQNRTSILQDWILTGEVPPGAPLLVRVGIWAGGDDIRVFANDKFLFSVHDEVISNGGIAFYALSGGPNALTVNFKDLVIRRIQRFPNQTSTPLPTLVPSRTPVPSSTPQPSRTAVPSLTPSITPSSTPTRTPTITRTPTPTRTPLVTPIPTRAP